MNEGIISQAEHYAKDKAWPEAEQAEENIEAQPSSTQNTLLLSQNLLYMSFVVHLGFNIVWIVQYLIQYLRQ